MTKKKSPKTTDKPIKVHPRDLPLSCPPVGVPLWNLHPQVYLPIEKTGHERCPYCGTEYILMES